MDKRRNWFAIVLEEALSLGILEPEDVVRHTTPSVLATDLPPTLIAALIEAGLTQGSFDAALLVNRLGPRAIAEHMPLPVLWNCIDAAAERMIGEQPSSAAPPMPRTDGMGFPDVYVDEGAPEIEVVEE